MNVLSPTAASNLFRSEPDRYIDVGAGEVAYRRVGSGPDVLFIHGWPVSGATWRKLLPYMVEHVTCHVIDLPSTGSSRFDSSTTLSVGQHIKSVRRVVDSLGLTELAVVGQDSGGLIARHALVDDPRMVALGLINTEPPDPAMRFRASVALRNMPGLRSALSWIAGSPRMRVSPAGFGSFFADPAMLDGEFAEFFFAPLHNDRRYQEATMKVLKSFDMGYVTTLADLHRRIQVPVKLVWGDQDPFFPVARARAMVSEFPNANLDVLDGVGLFSHEEDPGRVAECLLPFLTGANP